LDPKWVMSYEGIVRANSTLSLLAEATDIGTDDANRIKGEALFLRAYFHFELYKVWGKVPYFTEEDEEFIKSNEDATTLEDAIEDLKVAIPLLPEEQGQVGRVNQLAAKAFLGKLYLYGPSKDAAAAEPLLEDVVSKRTL